MGLISCFECGEIHDIPEEEQLFSSYSCDNCIAKFLTELEEENKDEKQEKLFEAEEKEAQEAASCEEETNEHQTNNLHWKITFVTGSIFFLCLLIRKNLAPEAFLLFVIVGFAAFCIEGYKIVFKKEKEKKVDVATKEKEEAEQRKLKAETEARQKLSVAELDRQAAEEEKQALIARGEGEAEARRLIYQADNALEARLRTAVEIEKVWAEALGMYQGKIVPDITFGGNTNGNPTNGFENFMQILSVREAHNLVKDYDGKEQHPLQTVPAEQK